MSALCRRFLLAVFVVAPALATGCATTSALIYSRGLSPAPRENARTEWVPVPGFTESVTVTLHPAGLPAPPTATAPKKRATPRAEIPPRITCSTTQTAENINYTAATRYGTRWKILTGVSFILEASLASLYLFTDPKPGDSRELHLAAGAFLAADAVGSLGLAFVPSRDVFETETRETITPVRSDCPDNLTIEIGADVITVDAGGQLGHLGGEQLTRGVTTVDQELVIRLGSHHTTILPSISQRCGWARARGITNSDACRLPAEGGTGAIEAAVSVVPGTLSCPPSEPCGSSDKLPSTAHRY